MIRAHAVDLSGISIAVVASRRVNFDTPPLKGRCGAPGALVVYLTESLLITKSAAPCGADRNQRFIEQIGGGMGSNGVTTNLANMRTRTASTKVTGGEFLELESFAARQGKSISEWIRQTLLTEARSQRDGSMSLHIFTELVGLQMLLMDTLEPLLCGDRHTHEQVAAIFRQVQTTKAAKALELLAKRGQNREK